MKLAGWLVALAALLPRAAAGQQVVDVGSNGSLGPLNVAPGETTRLVMPEDGVFHYTTIQIAGTVNFTPNAHNTPVYLLATGDVNVAGTLVVAGSQGTNIAGGIAGPGGFDGGAPSTADKPPGWGRGPGGGAPFVAGTFSYDRPLMMPLVGGSGGGGSPFGGGGAEVGRSSSGRTRRSASAAR